MHKYLYIIIFFLFGQITFAQFPESFEGGVFPPEGWITFNNGIGENFEWRVAEEAFTGNFGAFVRWENVEDGIAEDWLVSPRFSPSDKAHVLSFYQKDSYQVNYASEYFVMVSTTSQDNPADFEVIDHQFETDMSLNFSYHEVDLVNYIGKDIYVAFVMKNDDGDNWVIDDVNLSNCEIPGERFSDNQSATGADLFWEDNGADFWDIEIVDYGEVPTGYPQYTNITHIPFTWEDGEAFKRYAFHIRSNCSDGTVSSYSQATDILTSCGNTSCDYLFVLEDAYGDDWNNAYIEIRQNEITIGEITQEERGFGPYYFYLPLCDEYPFELVWHSGNWDQECIFSLYDLYDQQYFHFDAGDAPENEVVFYSAEADCDPVTCRFPFDVETGNYTQRGADIDWLDKDNPTNWEIEFVPYGSLPTGLATVDNISEKPFRWTEGEPGTYYEVYVRSVCGQDDESKWSVPTTFSTLCDQVYTEFPHNEDFRTEFELPSCWFRIQDGESYNTWQIGPDTYSNDSLVFCEYDDADQDEWLIAPAFDFSSAIEKLTLAFDWKTSYYWMVYPYNRGDLNLRISLDQGKNWSDPLWSEDSEPSFGSFEWQTSEIDLTAYLGEPQVWIAFQYLANDASNVYIDNFKLSDGSGSITSVNHQSDSKGMINLFPNPAGDYLRYNGIDHSNTLIKILDVNGQLVFEKDFTNAKDEKIDISSLSPGIYFFTYFDNDQTVYKRFIKL